MQYLSLLLLFSLLFTNCTSEEKETACFSFDLRQCNSDPWNENPNQNTDAASLLSSCQAYLESEGISVDVITLDSGFHTIVCQACTVCPVGPRYYIQIEIEQEEQLTALQLLNFEAADCSLLQ